MPARRPLITAAFALCALPFTAQPAEWLADRDIGTFCQQFLVRPDSPSGTVCLSYIQGYLDGLRTTEIPAASELEYHQDDVSAEEAEHISAVRMNALVEEYGPAARAGICLPKEFSADRIARVVARELRHGDSYSHGALDDYAQAALREQYPCDTSDPREHDGQDEAPDHEPDDATNPVQ